MRRLSANASLPEIECIELLENIEEAYGREFGVAPFNVSHWDPTDEFQTEMLRHLELPPLPSTVPYRFSYEVEETRPVIEKLGANADAHFGVLTPSTTTSILCVLNWLKCRRGKTKTIIAACPAYFSLFQACRRFGLPIRATYLRRVNGKFMLPPPNNPIWRDRGVLWLTSPVYGAGVYLNREDIAFVDQLLAAGWTVIADECLALPGRELIRTLGHHTNFLSIYSPHKSICVNGVKFSAVVFSVEHQAFMERWVDVWYGGLDCANSLALTHYLSPNYAQFAARFFEAVKPQRAIFDHFCREGGIESDPGAEGHFVSCYLPRVSARLGTSAKFLERLVYDTGGSLITGNRSRFHGSFGLSFRVNLARSGPRFEPTLARLMAHFRALAN